MEIIPILSDDDPYFCQHRFGSILVSTFLLENGSDEALQASLLHEEAHFQRQWKDFFVIWFMCSFMVFVGILLLPMLLLSVSAVILSYLVLASYLRHVEFQCDEYVFKEAGADPTFMMLTDIYKNRRRRFFFLELFYYHPSPINRIYRLFPEVRI